LRGGRLGVVQRECSEVKSGGRCAPKLDKPKITCPLPGLAAMMPSDMH
jgi:hypothetical protein